MKVAIVGARGRESQEDRAKVGQLMEACAKRYRFCCFITMLTAGGIGKFVKDKAQEMDGEGRVKYPLIEVQIRILGMLDKSEQADVYLARNATLFELGDIFYYFAMPERRGPMEDLIQSRVEPSGRPYRVFLPDDEVELIR